MGAPFLAALMVAASLAAPAVPASLRSHALASAGPTIEVAVLGRTVERGEALSAGDFSVERRAVGLAHGALPMAAAVGLEATRRLMAGSVVRASDLARPQVVHRGEGVTIAFRTGGLSITTRGRALSGGGVGDPVRVVSLVTNHTLDAEVEGTGRVRLMDQ